MNSLLDGIRKSAALGMNYDQFVKLFRNARRIQRIPKSYEFFTGEDMALAAERMDRELNGLPEEDLQRYNRLLRRPK